jgi:hypothetical protein
MKIKKFIVIFMICLLILTIIATELYIRYTEYTLKKDLKAAIEDYTIEYCNKEVEIEKIALSYSWNEAYWEAETSTDINYISGAIYDGKVQLNKFPCTEIDGFILH